MRHGSLFSGIGGFDYAADKMGWENVFHCEKDAFCQKVLNYYFPKSIQYEDITVTDFRRHRNKIDILTGGFPCQPYSAAGKRLGKEDDRHLWPEMLRAIREIRPTWVVGENVFGLINWNRGLVFDEVQADLEAEGYEVQPYVLPACSVGAPHRRDRVWFISRLISNTGSNGSSRNKEFQKRSNCKRNRVSFNEFNALYASKFTSNSNSERLQGWAFRYQPKKRPQPNEKQSKRCDEFSRQNWKKFPTQPPICSGNDGFPNGLDGITFPKWRSESIKAYGNAIVPQVAIQIFKAIISYNDMDNNV